ncbi:mitochondrial fission regulator 2 isoform X1 [Arapaima gigas]
MSLFADILELVRYVLEYFGVPADMVVPVWESRLCGQYRSLVRMIGTNLPLTPCPRVHFQVPLLTPQWHDSEESPDEGPVVPSFADVMWVSASDRGPFTKFRNCVHHQRGDGVQEKSAALLLRRRLETVEEPSNDAALKKITALEDELLRLRAQIAMIVSAPPGVLGAGSQILSQERTCDRGIVKTAACMLKDRATRCCPEVPGRLKQAEESEHGKAPRMLEVLKELNQVKLRVVDRSPGGTPVRKVKMKASVPSSDPAAIIAEALKRKFAHRHQEESFDKENHSFESSPFGSPEVPSVSHHIRREQGRLHV